MKTILRHLAFVAAALGIAATSSFTTPLAHADGGATMAECTAAGNVWVVVQAPAEFTGGEAMDIQGCAEAPTSGTDALEQIGVELNVADSLISQINGVPVEVPQTFDGNYWNYWTTTPVEGSSTELNPWTYATTGADEAKPAPGSVEGWYYNNPGMETMVCALPNSLSDKPAATSPSPSPAVTTEDSDAGSSTTVWIVTGVVVVLVISFVVGRRYLGAKN